jgi:hypothetical protein
VPEGPRRLEIREVREQLRHGALLRRSDSRDRPGLDVEDAIPERRGHGIGEQRFGVRDEARGELRVDVPTAPRRDDFTRAVDTADRDVCRG